MSRDAGAGRNVSSWDQVVVELGTERRESLRALLEDLTESRPMPAEELVNDIIDRAVALRDPSEPTSDFVAGWQALVDSTQEVALEWDERFGTETADEILDWLARAEPRELAGAMAMFLACDAGKVSAEEVCRALVPLTALQRQLLVLAVVFDLPDHQLDGLYRARKGQFEVEVGVAWTYFRAEFASLTGNQIYSSRDNPS